MLLDEIKRLELDIEHCKDIVLIGVQVATKRLVLLERLLHRISIKLQCNTKTKEKCISSIRSIQLVLALEMMRLWKHLPSTMRRKQNWIPCTKNYIKSQMVGTVSFVGGKLNDDALFHPTVCCLWRDHERLSSVGHHHWHRHADSNHRSNPSQKRI